MDRKHRFVAHGLIERDGTYLVLRRRDDRYLGGQWDVPGGTVEEGESPAQAAVRECLEETGLHAVAGEQVSHFQNRDTKGSHVTFHTLTYRLRLTDGDGRVRLSPEEHDEFRWLRPADAVTLPLVWHVARTLAGLDGQ